MKTPLEGPTTFEEVGGQTTQLLGDKGAVGAFDLGVPTGGGGTPPAKMVEVGVDIPSVDISIMLLTRAPIASEVNGRTWTIKGLFKLIKWG